MNNFIFSVNVTLPIFIVILLGYVLKSLKLINDNFVSVTNKYVFRVALPVLLFNDIATSDILSQAKGNFVLFCMLCTIAMFLIVWLFAFLFLKDKSMVGAFAQAASRGSAAILGVAFVENICGNAGMAPLMIVSAVPLFNILSVIILTFSSEMGKNLSEMGKKSSVRGDGAVKEEANRGVVEEDKKEKDAAARDRKKTIKKALVNILKNPIIIGIVLGIPFAWLKIKIPVMPSRVIDYIGRTATPMALIAIGGGFNKKEALSRLKPAVGASLVKLVVLPMVFLPIAVKMKFASSEMVAILIMLASPTTVSAYVMAKEMDNDCILTSNAIMFTTLFSSVSLTFWIYLLRSMGII
ncbi:MAG: AEC family transporter [Eubacterium sp.]|nr:AEC family transporter [Eubacterium sp.]